ncbi:DUF1120 domain-containing protein [Variovorax sp. KBS0712]|uniref:DUF1120 domain-containing protein n=1 Tax=Variovorax sp. KBS0712 TaxID=2578111 RepID=UPI001174F9A8|nr:DUF1120 domain-containing protein [Variovorax sp. KBS0712]TSD60059.1 DUF1120 domain-containing protein [Variovorax sp. KBS0712]
MKSFSEVLEEISVKKIATLAAVASMVAVMFVPGQASADSAELRIAGTIAPSPCTPAFTGGGVVDYGKIPAKSLNSTAQTTLADKTIQLSVTCDAPLLFGFKVIDERASTAVTSLTTIAGYAPNKKFGLGASDGKNIGAYSLVVASQTADGGSATSIGTMNGGVNWATHPPGFGLMADGGEIISTRVDGQGPSARRSGTADIRVVTAIDKGSNLPLTHAIPLDGLSTFELVYL